MTYREAAKNAHISIQHARQIMSKLRRMSLHPSRLSETVVPSTLWEHDGIKGQRIHRIFWIEQVKKVSECLRSK